MSCARIYHLSLQIIKGLTSIKYKVIDILKLAVTLHEELQNTNADWGTKEWYRAMVRKMIRDLCSQLGRDAVNVNYECLIDKLRHILDITPGEFITLVDMTTNDNKVFQSVLNDIERIYMPISVFPSIMDYMN
jgi:hypothetical protein